jgi:hypothetical protein
MRRNDRDNRRFTGRSALAVGLAVSLYATTSLALGTSEQRAACTSDVFRLCSSEIPSVDRIVACLRKEKVNLSPGCQAVFNSPEVQPVGRTRSLAAPEIEWCLFGTNGGDSGQTDWLKWCGTTARWQ